MSPQPFIAYAVQRYPALRTTFIRREIEALRKLGMNIEVFSMRNADAGSLGDDADTRAHLATTHFLPANPIGIGSIWANMIWAVRRPRVTLRNVRLAMAYPGVSGRFRRLRLVLQVWRAAPMASAIRRTGNCSHIHAHFADGAATTALACARLLGVGFSFTSHTSHDSPALREKLSKARFIASISEYDRRRLLELGGPAVKCPIHVIRCGIPLEQWPFEPKMALGRPLRILSVGALVETKGHDVLIRACAILHERGIDLKCRIDGDGVLRDELDALARELGAEQSVELTGARTQEQVRAELRDTDLFVLACKRAHNGDTEGVPVSLMEAMAMGRPAISTRISGIPELIEDGETGWLAEAGDAASLADVIERAVRSGPTATLSAARARIEQMFDSSREAAKLAQILVQETGIEIGEPGTRTKPPEAHESIRKESLLETADLRHD